MDVKKVKIGGKDYLELPEDLKDSRVLVIKIKKKIYLVGDEKYVRYFIGDAVRNFLREGRKIRTNTKNGRDYWVFDSEVEAVEFSRRHATEFSSGEILGVRSFDGKFYAIRRSLYTRILPRILEVLKETPSTIDDVANSVKLPKDLVRCVLEIAREEGTVVERQGGVYAYAG